MALARIITRSQACSRELAIDLLARGYTVEIVSPDKIPDNIADLELRVDEGPGDHLNATVEVHNGGRSASLDFVHHLKAPMGDFMRRPPASNEAYRRIGEPAAVVAMPTSDVANVEQLAGTERLEFEASSTPLAIALDPKIERTISRVLPTDPLAWNSTGADAKSTTPLKKKETGRVSAAPPIHARRRRNFLGWHWYDVITFASVVVLGLLLVFATRRTDKASANNSTAAPVSVSAKVDLDKTASAKTESPRTIAAGSISYKNPAQSMTQPLTQKAVVKTVPSLVAAPKTNESLVAKDTVTYLDKRAAVGAKPKPAKVRLVAAKSPSKTKLRYAHKHPATPTNHGGIIAANSITYFNDKPAQKIAK